MKQPKEWVHQPRLISDAEWQALANNFEVLKYNTLDMAPALMERLEHYAGRPSRKETPDDRSGVQPN